MPCQSTWHIASCEEAAREGVREDQRLLVERADCGKGEDAGVGEDLQRLGKRQGVGGGNVFDEADGIVKAEGEVHILP